MPERNPDLPAPDADGRAHSERVSSHIRALIDDAGGAIPFVEYMQQALYAPGLGYYRAGNEKFGAAGDFVTAPEVSPLFSHVLGNQVAEALTASGGDTVLELGAGSGRLALDLLRRLRHLDSLPDHYLILELSGELAARQRTLLATEPDLAARVEWIERLPENPVHGVVLANEVADALPVECFVQTESGVVRRGVTWRENGFSWCDLPAEAPMQALVTDLATRYQWTPPYFSEYCPSLGGWIQTLAGILGRGLLLMFDYGLPEREYYHPDRAMGTLMCHYRHLAHDNPFLWPGLTDITAWVDFTALAAAGRSAGLEVAGYTTQAHFLLGGGIGDALEQAADEREQLRIAGEIKRLTLPSEMGEAFKAIALARDCPPPSGFAFRNMAGRLLP